MGTVTVDGQVTVDFAPFLELRPEPVLVDQLRRAAKAFGGADEVSEHAAHVPCSAVGRAAPVDLRERAQELQHAAVLGGRHQPPLVAGNPPARVNLRCLCCHRRHTSCESSLKHGHGLRLLGMPVTPARSSGVRLRSLPLLPDRVVAS